MSFDVSRLRRSDQVIGVSAIAFLIFLFIFKWYGGSASSSVDGVNFSSSANGWHTFTNSRWIWLITIVVALAAVALSAGVFEFKSPVQPGVIVAALGALSAILIAYRIVHHPSGGASGSFGAVHVSYSYGIKLGIWLGLIAAVGVAYGGYLAMRDEGTSLADVRQQASDALGNLSAATSSEQAPPSTGAAEPAAPPIPPAPAPPTSEPPGAAPA